ncbi:MAG: thioredoxin-like domain-containing protein [Bacteroidota bacterium]
MMKKPGSIILLILLIAASCKNEDKIIIRGEVANASHDYLQVLMVNLNNTIFVDSVRINSSGNFKIELEDAEPAFYSIGYSDDEFVTVVAEPGNRINLVFRGKKLQNDYLVEGSEESEKVRMLDRKLGESVLKLDSLVDEYQEVLEKTDMQEKAAEIEEAYSNLLEQQRKYNIAFILDNLNKLSAVKALYQKVNENMYVLYRERDLQYLKLVSDSLDKYYPDITLTKLLKENLEEELNNMYINRLSQSANEVAITDLDVYLEDINGKKVRLSDLMKDNYVLLSFWSAESNECISNNLAMKQMYRLYHNEGFEIYQVNLDADEELWKSSVRFDELPWIHVREDDPSKPLTARMFNVTGVPANYLFDMEGNIIGKNLFGRSLQIKLGQIFD